MVVAKKGDCIQSMGITVKIDKILYQDCADQGLFDIEFIDTQGGYRHWKQYFDGGVFLPQQKPEEKALDILRKCDGNCKSCDKLAADSAANECGGVYAFRCTVAEGYTIRCNSLANLRAETIAHLEFEIS